MWKLQIHKKRKKNILKESVTWITNKTILKIRMHEKWPNTKTRECPSL